MTKGRQRISEHLRNCIWIEDFQIDHLDDDQILKVTLCVRSEEEVTQTQIRRIYE